MNTKGLLPVLLVPTLIVLIPVSAMLFKVEGWKWRPLDFVGAWVVMVGVGLAFKFIAQRATNWSYRIGTALALLGGFLLLWINGAVGIIGSEENPANLLYAAVLLIGVVGIALARLKPLGMARTSFAMAAAQLLVPVIALLIRPNDFSPGVVQVFALNACWVALFTVAGLFFRSAANRAPLPIEVATA